MYIVLQHSNIYHKEKMKAKKMITIAVTVIAALMVVMSGMMKLTGSKELVDGLTKVGVGEYLTILGLMEIGFTALFLYPKTMKIGFILLAATLQAHWRPSFHMARLSTQYFRWHSSG